jgi:hypothetical protein
MKLLCTKSLTNLGLFGYRVTSISVNSDLHCLVCAMAFGNKPGWDDLLLDASRPAITLLWLPGKKEICKIYSARRTNLIGALWWSRSRVLAHSLAGWQILAGDNLRCAMKGETRIVAAAIGKTPRTLPWVITRNLRYDYSVRQLTYKGKLKSSEPGVVLAEDETLRTIALHPSGDYLALAGCHASENFENPLGRQFIRLLHLRKRTVHTIYCSSPVRKIFISVNGYCIAWLGTNARPQIAVYDVENMLKGLPPRHSLTQFPAIVAVDYDYGSNSLFVLQASGELTSWSCDSWKLENRLGSADRHVIHLSMCENKNILTADKFGNLSLWSIQ